MAFLLRRRQDTAANWASVDPVIPDRQFALTQDGGGTGICLIKIGNGVDTWSNLPYVNKRNNFTATVNPTVSNNAASFYSIGSMWVNVTAKTMFVLTSFSGSDAVWQPIGELILNLSQVQDVPAYPNDGYEYVLTELDGVLSWELPSGGGGGAVDSVNGQTGVVVLDLDDINDVPAYPNDGYDYVLVENNEVLTWELYSSGGGSGTVESVTGDSVDNTDPDNPIVNAIPLSGTEVGSPVTGDIELEGDGADLSIYFIDENGDRKAINFSTSGFNFINWVDYDGNPSVFTSIVIDPITGGVYANLYFTPTSDNHFIQKKYADDNFGTGVVETVVGTTNEISVDSTDPANPIVSLPTAVTDSLALADSALQSADNLSDLANAATARANLGITEEVITGTATYDATMTGTEDLDLDTFTDHYGILTGNTTITVSNTPASGKTFVRSLTIKSDTTESLTLPVSWTVIGTYLADGTENDLEIKFTNYPTVGLKVWCYINDAS